MKTIKELLDEVIDLEGKVQISQAIDFHKGVPTLEKGVYRNVSPMLKIRYGAFGKWINATHGDWLDTKEDVMIKIARLVEKNHCEFAYPTQVVHLKQEQKIEDLS